jgi:hypothetical protein
VVKFRIRAVAEDLSLNLDGSKVGVEIDFSSSVHCLGRFV